MDYTAIRRSQRLMPDDSSKKADRLSGRSASSIAWGLLCLGKAFIVSLRVTNSSGRAGPGAGSESCAGQVTVPAKCRQRDPTFYD